MLGHPLAYQEQMLSEETAAALRQLVREHGEFPTLAADLKFYRTLREHIGEAQPIGADGKCSHPLLMPSSDRSACVLAGRVDVARHFVKYGGVGGLKESYETLVSRTLSFGAYLYNLSSYPVVERLFADDGFLSAARAVCPPDRQHLDPFQFNFIIGTPGQTVPLHIDAPYFWGASRFEFPQWLLAVMVSSGLWQQRYVDQVQIVAYLHEWDDDSRGGNFVYWNDHDQRMKTVPPRPRSGSAVDGAKTIHAGDVYRPDYVLPALDKSAVHSLRREHNATWSLISGGRSLRSFTDNDIRMAIVYRARCFRSADDAHRFRHQPADSMLQLDDILLTFARDLHSRGRVASIQAVIDMPRLDLAVLLMDEYLAYPLPQDAIIPINYCAVGLMFPALSPYVKWLGCH